MALAPFAGSRIGLLVTNLIGDTKGEHYFESATEAIEEAHRLMQWPDTQVSLFDTAIGGERNATPFAIIARDGLTVKWTSLLG